MLMVARSPARPSSWQDTSPSTVTSSRFPPLYGGFPAWPRPIVWPTCLTLPRASSSRRFFGGSKELTAAARNRLSPLRARMLEIVCSGLGRSLHDIRDRALFLVGFASGMRRSELCSLQVEQVTLTAAGAELLLLRSKNDGDGKGRVIKLTRTGGSLCPVQALQDWLEYGALGSGPLFRPIDRWGRVLDRALSGEAVGELLRQPALRCRDWR